MMEAAQGVCILNVDDTDAARYVKSRDLRRAGFDITEARNGTEALRLIEQYHPPVVLLDVHLPDISGIEVCRFVKRRWPEIMVLMTSATFTTSFDRTMGLDAGADSYLVQPSEPLELAAAINALLRLRRSEDKLRELNRTLEERVEARVVELAEANARLVTEIEQREKAETALVQSQKMEAVGQLTGGLAHDFNNLLTAVIGSLDLIKLRSPDAQIQRLADRAYKAADRGSKLTAKLLSFSRTHRLSAEPVDVNTLISGMRELLNQSLGASVSIEMVLDPLLPVAMADTNQLELAILNLSINARDAMPDGGIVKITTGLSRDPGAITVEVADTGSGMSPDVLARAFDPFFTTKPIGKGTGLGLSQVYGIARQSGGDVTLASEVGKGTTVTLRLPRATDSAVARHQVADSSIESANSERILVVDDDEDVREFIAGYLPELGYEVQAASHGDAALTILEKFTPNLLIVDFAMPGMSGAELAVAVRQRYRRMRILFLSGFADAAALDAAVGTSPFLRKPFRPSELAAAVRAALDARLRE
ncbi:MAG TPA: response regulator [Stellaceae bacterium]|jgi:DNA-binding response OmpR family regulator/anti-sigma regulatory factor (Ser/Thr protein kinase)|nr:response regulator [Stellaceae bacterium]